tara:strand:+ start:3420 stop:3923 length:504 start_codon:yes stop_codon:yes gene_type:complete
MEELAALLAEFLEDWVLEESALTMSAMDALVGELAFDAAVEGEVEAIVDTFADFKAWCAKTLPSVSEILNGIVGLQMIYNMIATHSKYVIENQRLITLEVAMGDIEATLVAKHAEARAAAQNLLKDGNLSANSIAALQKTADLSAIDYWKNTRYPIMLSLQKLPIYS